MNPRMLQMVSVGLGAAVMYLLDPAAGRRRRALLRDQAAGARKDIRDAARKTRRDLVNRSRGILAELRSGLSNEQVSDDALAQRVRSQIGRIVAHPGSIDVTAHDGGVCLSGPVLTEEVDRLLDRVSSIRGVNNIENCLEVYEQAEHIPGLQGKPARRGGGSRLDIMQSNWSPSTRLLMGTTGGAAAIYGLGRRGLSGIMLGAAGLAALARAVTNRELKLLFGLGAPKYGVSLKKTVTIMAPVDRVFGLWSDYQHFPYFMTHVHEVERLDDRRSRWTVSGPGGVPVYWEAVTTEFVPNAVIGWRTAGHSSVHHSGTVHFRPNPDGTTTVDVELSYSPVAGAVGHAIAQLLGADPESRMDDDLLRMKDFIETGVAPRDAAKQPQATPCL